MKIQLENAGYHIEILNEEKEQALVFLHGFTGSGKTWLETAARLPDYKIVLVDLIGHGQTDSPEDSEKCSMEQQILDLEGLFDRLGLTEITLIGYSMGGRTALSYACAYPARLQALVLESASPGLKTDGERRERQERDARLAEKILENGLVSFVDKWEKIPLFDSQKLLPERMRKAVRKERLAQNPKGLANSLIGMGTGAQASNWECLSRLELPVLLITGRLDLKFMAIAEEMVRMLPDGEWKSVETGHAIHVEKPAEFATIVDEYLNSINRGGKS